MFKEATAQIRSLLDRIAQGECEMDSSSSLDEFCAESVWMLRLSDVFEQDMQACGQYVPPMTIQIVRQRPDGSVLQIHTLESSGLQIQEGGVVEIPPGAPPGFDSDIAALFRDSKARHEGELIVSHHQMAVAGLTDIPSSP